MAGSQYRVHLGHLWLGCDRLLSTVHHVELLSFFFGESMRVSNIKNWSCQLLLLFIGFWNFCILMASFLNHNRELQLIFGFRLHPGWGVSGKLVLPLHRQDRSMSLVQVWYLELWTRRG